MIWKCLPKVFIGIVALHFITNLDEGLHAQVAKESDCSKPCAKYSFGNACLILLVLEEENLVSYYQLVYLLDF